MHQLHNIIQKASEKKVSDWVTENIRTAHVFKKYDIDFCCGGGVSVEAACKKAGVPVDLLMSELSNVNHEQDKAHDFDHFTLIELANHIEKEHHSYVREAIILLVQYSEKVAMVHGGKLPELNTIRDLVRELGEKMLSHMHKEEKILFPYIRFLEGSSNYGDKIDPPPFGSVANPIQMMEAEHDHAGDITKEIARITDNYTPPEWACNTFRALYAKLQEFEDDLHIHVHLENNILFPKATALETTLLALS